MGVDLRNHRFAPGLPPGRVNPRMLPCIRVLVMDFTFLWRCSSFSWDTRTLGVLAVPARPASEITARAPTVRFCHARNATPAKAGARRCTLCTQPKAILFN